MEGGREGGRGREEEGSEGGRGREEGKGRRRQGEINNVPNLEEN